MDIVEESELINSAQLSSNCKDLTSFNSSEFSEFRKITIAECKQIIFDR